MGTQSGEIWEDGIRYILMRPDVLMGTSRELDGSTSADFLRALETSAHRHVQASLDRYQQANPLFTADFLENVCAAAGKLGWGRWAVAERSARAVILQVSSSPFAEGYGSSAVPVCAPISGVLRAAAQRAYGAECPVSEQTCAAQGAHVCSFEVKLITPSVQSGGK